MKGFSRTNFNYCYDTNTISRWVNNPTLTEFCFSMIGRADIEESKSNVAMNAWLPQASYPCGHLRYLLTDVPPQPNSPLDNVNNVGHARKRLILEESSSTGSSFPADSAKPVPLAVVSLDNSQIPLVRTSSKLVVKRKLGSSGYEDLEAVPKQDPKAPLETTLQPSIPKVHIYPTP
ncbi:hypothetical protein [Parasitella parasitica]|uniref:Uncharacterized protein n=1 Tax=Parasitella parasitica TaxID=35722 RepID=A0A0B7MTI6_9FUNG|nr:hypothetical protein [Parasitella parasitica]